MHFVKFRVGRTFSCHIDSVRIYDGKDATAPLIHSFCGTNIPGDVLSSGNIVYVTFVSRGSVRNSGFRMKYSAFVPVAGKQK